MQGCLTVLYIGPRGGAKGRGQGRGPRGGAKRRGQGRGQGVQGDTVSAQFASDSHTPSDAHTVVGHDCQSACNTSNIDHTYTITPVSLPPSHQSHSHPHTTFTPVSLHHTPHSHHHTTHFHPHTSLTPSHHSLPPSHHLHTTHSHPHITFTPVSLPPSHHLHTSLTRTLTTP